MDKHVLDVLKPLQIYILPKGMGNPPVEKDTEVCFRLINEPRGGATTGGGIVVESHEVEALVDTGTQAKPPAIPTTIEVVGGCGDVGDTKSSKLTEASYEL